MEPLTLSNEETNIGGEKVRPQKSIPQEETQVDGSKLIRGKDNLETTKNEE